MTAVLLAENLRGSSLAPAAAEEEAAAGGSGKMNLWSASIA